MTTRILMLRSNPVHSDPRVDKIARALGQDGHRVSVLAWDFTGEHLPHEVRPDYSISRIDLPVKFGRGLGNLILELRWQWRLLRWLIANQAGYDLLHACDFDTILPALFCGRLFKKRVIYDIFDFYADMLRQTPEILKRAIKRIDLWAIDRADGVILADDRRREQIKDSAPKHCVVIYNSPEDEYRSLEISEGSPAGELKLAYIGLLQRERGLLDTIRVIARHPDWTFDLGGSGAEQDIILTLARNLENFRWHGRVPYEQALRINAGADVMIAIFDPAIPNHRYSSSNKLFEALMLGKPIVVARGTNMDRVVIEHQCGLVIEYGEADELDAALSRLADDPQLRQRCGANGRKAYQAAYDWSIMQERLQQFYKLVVAN